MSEIEIGCIFCGKGSQRIAWEENGFTGKRCECGLLYVSPRPSLPEMIDWYNSKEANADACVRIESEFFKRLNSRHRLKLLQKFRTKGRLLEYPNEYFDVVITNENLSHIREMEESIAEVHRASKAGGSF